MDPDVLEALNDSFLDEGNLRAKIILYGDPGAGKTTLGATIGKKILMVAADPEGWQSLINHPELGLGTRIKVMEYKGISQLEFVADAVVEGAKGFREFDTINVDTLSHVVGMDLDLVTKVNIDKKGYVGGEKTLEKMKFDYERDMFGVYNQNALRIKGALLKLFSSNVNIVATAHAYQRKIRATNTERTEPGFPPAVLAAINANVSLMAYMTANEAGLDSDGTVKYHRQIQYHPTRTIMAKTRIGGLPTTEDDPELKTIVDNWLAKGAQLLGHDEAEEIRDEPGLTVPGSEKSDEEDFGFGDS